MDATVRIVIFVLLLGLALFLTLLGVLVWKWPGRKKGGMMPIRLLFGGFFLAGMALTWYLNE